MFNRKHLLDREDSSPHKVMRRMDRRFRKHKLRSYYGYEMRGPLGAKLLFDDQIIEIGMFGTLRRVARVNS